MKKERTQIQLYLCGSEVVLCLYVSFRMYYGHRLLAQAILEPVFSVHCSKHVLVSSSAFIKLYQGLQISLSIDLNYQLCWHCYV